MDQVLAVAKTSLPNPSLAALLEALATKLEQYASRFERLHDSRCVFATTYSMMTRCLAEDIQTGGWHDPVKVVQLGEAFSRKYFAAINSFDLGQDDDGAWHRLQSTIRDFRSSVLQDLMAGMLGHIIHDLPLAVNEVLDPDHDVGDFHAVNDVLGRAIRPIRLAVQHRYAPWLRWLDVLGTKHEELLTDWGIRSTRSIAWYDAALLRNPNTSNAAAKTIESKPIAVLNELFAPPVWIIRVMIRFVNILVSIGRTWPRASRVRTPLFLDRPNHRYYFGTGAGTWQGLFRFRIVNWRSFWAAKLGAKNRMLALGMAGLMVLCRSARIHSEVVGYPEQGEGGIATNDVRISLFGVTLYRLIEQYALDPEGSDVYVRSYERFGPISWLLNVEKEHRARISEEGRHATYWIPLLGEDWTGEYTVKTGGATIESELSCAWARATELISKNAAVLESAH